MLFIKRVLANIVDVLVFLIILVGLLGFALPSFFAYAQIENELVIGTASFAFVIGAVFLAQYPFFVNNQTLGKGMLGLYIISTNDARPMSASIVLQRELFAKVMTFYFMALPVLFGRAGWHDTVCETKVI